MRERYNQGPMVKKIRRGVAIVLLLASLSLLIWGNLPGSRQSFSQYIEPTAMQVSASGSASIPALLEMRQVRVEWPDSLRIGDQADITLTFEPVKSEILLPSPETKLTDLYGYYALMADSRFEVAGLQVQPAEPRRESLPKGQTVKYRWQVSAQEVGKYAGIVWLSLRFLPLDGGQASEVTVFVHELDIRASSFLGLSGPVARLMGGIVIIVGIAFDYDVIIGRLTNRRKKQDTKVTKDTKDL